jgi:tRNA pseudouridine38-40 synthase
MRVFIELSYDGAPFHGWQRQPHCLSVQEVLEEKLALFVGEPVPVMGCGRTDTGVHASYFVAHADWPEDSPKAKRFKDWYEAAWKLNGMLPPSISIHRISEVAANAHARFDATERGYVYRMHTYKDPFLVGRSARIMRQTDFASMQAATHYLVQQGDFAAFCKAGSDNKTTLCDVRFAELRKDGEQYTFEIRADRFLRNMVRAIVGTLFEVGQGRMKPEDVAAVIASGDRSAAGASAPGEGLYLNRVVYPGFDPIQTKSFMKP